ncbi:MAG TPA: nucleotidyl transferase AbiEii/AbiGii toxin family protein [Sulfuricurvum sp.]|nr:nucleotidyl transferase AbiEii/AbiGii toxin family protein [Sulfuricurvum sp.]HQT37064.1 nucleotidyl transferase AbiEii/AbiGii toxin family protein [Sulfuricurvum sp.]
MANTHPALKKMLERYDLSTSAGSYDALREVLQEIVLLGLYEGGFFKHAAFYGGTALRILHGLPRFSEDLDFSLLQCDPQFDLSGFEQSVIETLRSFGFETSIEIKTKSIDTAVQSAFIKGNTILHLISIDAPKSVLGTFHRDQSVKIKIEVDTQPPLEFKTEEKLLLIPRPFNVKVMTPSSLFAGKMHAILCRAWATRPKGRDWYDFVWYIAHDTALDLNHLNARLNQSCKWLESNNITFNEAIDRDQLLLLIHQRIDQLDIEAAKKDIRPFIKDAAELDLWSKDFFLQVIQRLRVE